MASFSTQIVRRFPELDRFSDAERVAFVRETSKGWWVGRVTRLLMPWFMGGVAAVVTFALAWRAMTWGLQAKAVDAASDLWMGLVAVSYAAPVAVGYVAWSITRQRLLWRRVREALRDGLLPGVTAGSNEAPRNAGARRRYVIELLAMAVLTAAPEVAVVVGVAMVVNESHRAKLAKPGAAALNKLIATLPPARGKPSEPVWLTFAQLWGTVDKVEEQVWKEMGSPLYGNGNRLSPGYVLIGADSALEPEERRAEFVLEQQMAERMLPALKDAGVFDAARSIVGNSNVDAGVPPFSNDQAIMLLPRPGVRDTFNALRFNLGRMARAIKTKDTEEFADAFRVLSAAARVFEREPFFLSRSRAMDIDAITSNMVRRALMSNPDERWLKQIQALLAEGTPRVPLAYAIEADRLTEIDVVCYAFNKPENVAAKRIGLWYQEFKEARHERLGGLDENLGLIKDRYDRIAADLDKPRLERAAPPKNKDDLLLQRNRVDAVWALVRHADWRELDRRGLTIVCAVERFKAARGHYPAALSELVPDHLGSVPLDPWSGRPYSYKLVDPAKDAHGRSYLVYVWGNDNIDDGGKEPREYYAAITPPAQSDMDYVINYFARF